MAKIKSFKIRNLYLANYGDGDRTNVTDYEIPTSDIQSIVKELTELVSSKNIDQLNTLLKSEFVYPDSVRNYSRVNLNSFPESPYSLVKLGYHSFYNKTYKNINYGRGQRDTSFYEERMVAPVLEVLLSDEHRDTYLRLIEGADDDCQKALMDFNGMALKGVHFDGLETHCVNFSKADLRDTEGLTQEMLDKSLSYTHAKLPPLMIATWTDNVIKNIRSEITKLSDYAEKLSGSKDKSSQDKGALAEAIVETLTNDLDSTDNYNSQFQQEFCNQLHAYDNEFEVQRDGGLKTCLSNIALCIAGLGIGYVVAGLIHKAATGHFLFFDKTETSERIESISTSVSIANIMSR